ncbi:MAG: hypothetical protein D6B27_00860 [Gammaproteobacteria bacterium]|nr:MAG: hypothetical protein D6B27_00860 [Gammaproteobacteria bacterium]
MPLYTSSFSRKVPDDGLAKKLLLSLVAGAFIVVLAENIARLKGLEPNVRDSAGLWASQRELASDLGGGAVIIVGSSRSQLGIDLEVINRELEKIPVQLSVDGSPFLEVLENLAEDGDVAGSILVSAPIEKMFNKQERGKAGKWIDFYKSEFRGLWQPKIEEILKANLMSFSALYSSIVPPDLWPEILLGNRSIGANYLITKTNRGRDADYTKVKMPMFYLQRGLRHFGRSVENNRFTSVSDFEKKVVAEVLKERNMLSISADDVSRLRNALQKLTDRGVKVTLINFPKSGIVEKIDDIRYPKSTWIQAKKKLSISPLVTFIDYRDYENLDFECPDGSHIDVSQKSQFTHELLNVLIKEGAV